MITTTINETALREALDKHITIDRYEKWSVVLPCVLECRDAPWSDDDFRDFLAIMVRFMDEEFGIDHLLPLLEYPTMPETIEKVINVMLKYDDAPFIAATRDLLFLQRAYSR